ncbi:DUF86 domain-containing protein [Paenibacillus endoradicis]|uniref:DUF86 domain-containing protein n=1 Tax=Paenibacillus endoradicis TaxID=2972487 RepID=UPI0021590346|nr:HepT-like ribonuclease domain-containing protein [Paenibacillus endoradicis]MCR8659089.1 DUF86 domain-containing protein [Paenibacillus endoradicis]
MYYVNHEQIAIRLATIPTLTAAMEQLSKQWEGAALQALAQERALHLAIEIVTDIGSYLIDGFLMRDASSYEDIIEITSGEGVYPESMVPDLVELVRLRKPLVQDYYNWKSSELHPLLEKLPVLLVEFKVAVERYVEKELA